MTATSLKIAARDLRASWTRFAFVVLAVAAGVGALTGVRGFSESFRTMLFSEARTLMAADLFVRIFAEPTAEQRAAIESLTRKGAVHTPVTETLSMISGAAGTDPALVTLKAIDPQVFPLYGTVDLEPPRPLRDSLGPDTVLLSEDLRMRLQVRTGDSVRIGNEQFRVAGVLVKEPDRMSGSLSIGPRALLSSAALERAGLLGLGSRASRRFLFKLPPGAPPLTSAEAELKRAFPEGLVVNFRDLNPNVSRSIGRATTFLSLVSLIALVIGAIGVAAAMHAHLQTRLDSVAVMKSIGGKSGQIVRIYALQTVVLGLVGGTLGILAGLAVQSVFPVLIGQFLPVQPPTALAPGSALQGLALGVLTTLLFTVPPLLGIREIRPALILRRDMAEVRPGWGERLRRAWSGFAIAAAVSLGLAAVAGSLVSGSWQDAATIGSAFVGGLAVALLALGLVAAGLLRLLQLVVQRTPRLPIPLRHAMANLYRPGSQSRAVLIALGVGVMFTLTVYLIQSSVLDEIRRAAPPGAANVFFIDITAEQKDELLAIIGRHPRVERQPEMIAAVSSRLQAIDGVPVENRGLSPGVTRRYRMARNISTEGQIPVGTEVVRGKWWESGNTMPSISISEDAARLLRVQPGSTMTWMAFGRQIEARVAAVHRSDGQRLRSMLEFHASPGALEGLPTVYYAAARVANSEIGSLQRATFARFPTVTVINVADILDRVQQVVDQIAVVVRFISAFAILAGAVILASSVAGSRFRRIRELAIFKTLGATRGRMAAMFSAEFFILGTVAGLIGSLLATAFTWMLLMQFFDEAPFRFNGVAVALSVLATGLVACAAGWLASYRILEARPLEVLRGE